MSENRVDSVQVMTDVYLSGFKTGAASALGNFTTANEEEASESAHSLTLSLAQNAMPQILGEIAAIINDEHKGHNDDGPRIIEIDKVEE